MRLPWMIYLVDPDAYMAVVHEQTWAFQSALTHAPHGQIAVLTGSFRISLHFAVEYRQRCLPVFACARIFTLT